MALSPLALPPDEMRRLGYRVIDLIVEHFEHLPELPAMRVSSREKLELKFREPIPQVGKGADTAIDRVVNDVFASIGHLNHPRFFGFIPAPSNFVSVLADALVAGFTPFCGTWLEGSGPAQVEMVLIEWLRELFGLPTGAAGLFTSGGSIANLTALAAAREADRRTLPAHRFYCSDQTHSSLEGALKLLGYDRGQLRRITSDDHFRLDPAALAHVVADDRAAGLQPIAVIANAGTTNTGAVDPLGDVADVCARERLWMHVDGAYGAAAMLTPRGRVVLAGIERADSITLDPHKWLFQPYALGCVMVRDHRELRRCFFARPEYLQDTETDPGEINFSDYGPELTRPFRALKLWLSLQVFGADAFAAAIEHGLRLAESVQRRLDADDCWEIVAPASLGIVCFRYRGLADQQQQQIASAAADDGCCFVSTTMLRGRTVLRMCTIQPATSEEDLARSVACLRSYGEKGGA